MKKMLERIGKAYSLKEKAFDEFAKVKVKGMNFTIKSYEAEGLGHVSVMEAAGFFGLMKMDTLIINPLSKDMPLFSYDRVYAMGNDTLIVELYDTMLESTDLSGLSKVKEDYGNAFDHDLGKHWYDSIKLSESLSKKGKKKQTAEFDKLKESYFEAFMDAAEKAKECKIEAKQEKAKVYVEGLLQNGGPSTDVFKQGFGEEKTAKLFRKVLFGTE